MSISQLYLRGFVLAGLLFLVGCPPSSSSPDADTTPPNVNPVIQLGSPPPDTTNNGISIAAGDVTRSGIPMNIAIRLIAPAADGESKVTGFTLESNLTWQCFQGQAISTTLSVHNASLAFVPMITLTPNSTTQSFDGVVDPIAMTGCSIFAARGWGPMGIKGFVRVVAVNGAGMTTKSSKFNFDYKDVGDRSGTAHNSRNGPNK